MPKHKICGWLLMVSFSLSLTASFTQIIPSFWAGIPIWISAWLLLNDLKENQRQQVKLLFIIGLSALIFAMYHGVSDQYFIASLEANEKVINMLIAVGFLKLMVRKSDSEKQLPVGRGSLYRTLLGSHIFSAVLNMSSVVLVGDRLALQGRLSSLQGIILVRAFCICAFWSPFFSAMGIALTMAPGAQLTTLVLYGIPSAIVAISITIWELARKPQSSSTSGYPIGFDSLWLPCTLGLIVILIHVFLPKLNVLTLVSTITVGFTALYLMTNNGFKAGKALLKQHIEQGISASKGEVVLFATAALLASGIAAFVSTMHFNLAPTHFGYLEASLTVIVLVSLAMTGMHPVASVTLAGSILAPTVSDPNLLGLAMLMGWSLGIGLSPFSGVQISIQSRYDITARSLMKLNWQYAILMTMTCSMVLWLYTKYPLHLFHS